MKIVYTAPAGNVCVCVPTRGARQAFRGTEAQFLAFIAAKDVPVGSKNIQFVDDASIPRDRTFRNAWVQSGSTITHDMPKCREIHKERMRLARKPLLAELDVMQLRGMNVEAEKQALRDVTADPAIESARTPEELKAVWPEVLK